MLEIIPLLKAIPISEQRIKIQEPKNVSPDGSSPFSAIREAAIRAEDVKTSAAVDQDRESLRKIKPPSRCPDPVEEPSIGPFRLA